MRSSRLKAGVEEILLPGEPERRSTERRRREGIEIDATSMVTLRENNKKAWQETDAAVPSINDFVLKATANSLQSHPQLNAALIDNAIHQYLDIHLGVAVEVDAGLVVPVVHAVFLVCR